MALHATTIRFADRSYVAVARAADAQGISVSQYVREAALIRAVLDELDTAEEALHTAHDLLAVAREVRQLAQVDPPARRDQTPTSGPARSRGVTRPSRLARKWRSRFEATTRSAAVRGSLISAGLRCALRHSAPEALDCSWQIRSSGQGRLRIQHSASASCAAQANAAFTGCLRDPPK